MMPMMPNTSVSPLATRNSSSPYCTPFSSWMRKVWRSMEKAKAGASRQKRRPASAGLPAVPFPSCSRHLACLDRGGIVVERLHRHADVLVFRAGHFSQVDVLHRIVRLRQMPLAARAVDDDLFHRR